MDPYFHSLTQVLLLDYSIWPEPGDYEIKF